MRAHKYWEQACPDCGRLQPPKNVMSVIVGRNKRMEHIIEGYSPNQCLPNPENIKENY